MRRTHWIVLLVVTPTILISAQQKPSPPAEPWKWTLDQRLAVRFDPAARAARVAEAKARDARSHRSAGAAATIEAGEPPGDVIDGNTHPEVLFPTEIFAHFMNLLYVMDAVPWRNYIQPYCNDVLRSDADWDALTTMVASYGANLRQEHQLIEEEGSANRSRRIEIEVRLVAIRQERCALQKHALRRVRAYFGAERFDRFLYTVVTRGFGSTYSINDPVEQTRARLKANEEACQ